MNQLQENLLEWYHMKYSSPIKKPTSSFNLALFYSLQLIMTILVGMILCIFWLITPFILIVRLLASFIIKSIHYKTKNSYTNPNNHDAIYDKLKLILDLDNTLIFSSMQKLDKFRNFFRFDDKLYVYKRPYLDNFLQTLSEFCDLAIYTSSTQEYADKILGYIDKNNMIKEKFYRHNCVHINQTWYKDVLKFKSNQRKLLIIDDNPQCHLNMKENIIQIKFWNGDEKDDSLLKIKNIIKNFYKCGGFNVSEILSSILISEV